ncbi:MAG: hypothetical protein OFPI_43770 [Osedax symbiont Rs2]|nr:MAG: hypothetical protein OFPI_43770 [Osedax symbiont Rs2]
MPSIASFEFVFLALLSLFVGGLTVCLGSIIDYFYLEKTA